MLALGLDLWDADGRARVDALQQVVAVDVRYLAVDVDVLWERIEGRQADGAWPARPIERAELQSWFDAFEPPTPEELGQRNE